MSGHFATCIVRSAWEATEDTGLTIKVGDIIRITDSETYENWEENDWLYGTNPESSLSGWFPSTFTEVIDKDESAAAAVPDTEEPPPIEQTETTETNSDSVPESLDATDNSVPEILGTTTNSQESTETNQNTNEESVPATATKSSDPKPAEVAIDPAMSSGPIAIASEMEEETCGIASQNYSTQNNSDNTTDETTDNTVSNTISNAKRVKATIDQIASLRRAIAKLEIKKQHLVDLDDFSRCTKVQLEIEATQARITQLENNSNSRDLQVDNSAPPNIAQPALTSPKSANSPPSVAKASSPDAPTPPQLHPPSLSGTKLSSSASKPDGASVSFEASDSDTEESPVRRVRRADDLFNQDGTLAVAQKSLDGRSNSAASVATAATAPTDLLSDLEEPPPSGVRVVNKHVRLNKISMATVNASTSSTTINRSLSGSRTLPKPVFNAANVSGDRSSSDSTTVAALLSPPAGCHHGMPSGIMDMRTIPPLSLGSSRALVSPARSATRGAHRKRHFAEFPPRAPHVTRMTSNDAHIAAMLQEEELRRDRHSKREARRKQKQDAQIALMLQEVTVLLSVQSTNPSLTYMCVCHLN